MLVTYALKESYTNQFGLSRAQLIDAFLGNQIETSTISTHKEGYFRTRTIEVMTARRLDDTQILNIVHGLELILQTNTPMYYEHFNIPKRTGGMRQINTPNDELKRKQRQITEWFRRDVRVLMHQAAHAYVPHRSAFDALCEHAANKSRWFLKVDLADFFPSITAELLKEKLPNIYPMHVITTQQLNDLVETCILDGALPQGAPTSPILSNLVMVEFDKALTDVLWNFNNQRFIYTRYADDLLISSEYDFDPTIVVTEIKNVLRQHSYPMQINEDKTRYGSSSGANWNLGLMLNKEGRITVGTRRKKRIRAMVNEFMSTPVEDITIEYAQELQGQLAYLKFVEPNAYETLMTYYTSKYNERPSTLLTDIIRGVI